MLGNYLAQKGNGWAGRTAPAANARGAIGDYLDALDAQPRMPGSTADGRHLDAVEHLRQDRLKRWQMPTDPTREASS